jgi:plastocyanin
MFFSTSMNSQTLHQVELSNNLFTPSELSIDAGDTVRWVNTAGFHNVVADDGSFTSGAPSSDPWVYDHVFTTPGNNPYYCFVHGGPGGAGMSGVITVLQPNSVSSNNIVTSKFELEQNYPNPFNPSTNIKYSVLETGKVRLAVYNIIGEEVALLVNGILDAGFYEVTFSAINLPSGIYFSKLEANNFTQTRKMILLK